MTEAATVRHRWRGPWRLRRDETHVWWERPAFAGWDSRAGEVTRLVHRCLAGKHPPDELYFSSGYFVYKSLDGGHTWQALMGGSLAGPSPSEAA